MSLSRMATIMRKEILHIVRDPRNLFLVTLSPAFLLFLLSNVFSFGIDKFNLVVLDLDQTSLSRRYVATLTSDQDLDLAGVVNSYDEILPLLVSGQVDLALVIPPGFSATIYGGRPVQIQAVIDGADPSTGSGAASTIQARSEVFVAGVVAAGSQGGALIEIRSQALYNAGLESLLSMVPGLLAIVLVMPTMALALAFTREKESGTLEGLMATPISGLEYVSGKLLAYVAAGLVSAVLALLVAVLWFKVPFRGSLATFLLLTAVYLLACMSATVVIANFVESQQTAMFIVLIIFIVPSFFLAGLITPISTESIGSMLPSYALPSTHFVQISRVLFLKGLGLGYVLQPALLLLGMAGGALAIGLWLFKKKIA